MDIFCSSFCFTIKYTNYYMSIKRITFMTLSDHFVIRNKCCKSYDVNQRSHYTRRKTVKIDKDIAKGKIIVITGG